MSLKNRRLTISVDIDNEDDALLLSFLKDTLPKSKRTEWVKLTLLKAAKKKLHRQD